MSSFWRGHHATLNQQQLPSTPKRKRGSNPTQADVLIGLLREAHAERKPLDLPTIMRAGIAQHGARFKEIRNQGFEIENEMQRKEDGSIISYYWLRFDPEAITNEQP